MLKVLGKLPRDLTVAVSGGPDSMAILDFLSNNHNVTAAYFDHGTPFGTKCKSFVKEFCDDRDIDLVVGVNFNGICSLLITDRTRLFLTAIKTLLDPLCCLLNACWKTGVTGKKSHT